MRTTRLMVLATLLLGAHAALGDEQRAATPDVKSVFMWFGGGMLPGLWVSGHESGWNVPLPYAADDACTARLHDISPSPLPHLDRAEKLAPHQAALSLPRPRYTGSHTYRISFHCESSLVADVLVHLEPTADELAAWLGTPAPLPRRLASR